MTSKEALEKLCKVKIYQKEASAYDYLGKEIYKEEINTIKQALESLEALNKVWHDNEPMESVDINGKHLQELYNYINKLQQENEILKMSVIDTYDSANDIIFELQEIGSNLKQENEKLKKALYEACKILSWDCPCGQDLIDDLDCENRCQPDIDYSECWIKYFLKEVLG